jgi:hypothetical protein
MKRLVFPVALLALSVAHAQSPPEPTASGAATPSVALPRDVQDLVLAQPFTLAKGYKNTWSAQRETVTSGVVVVLKVEPTLAVRRDALERVLYAGNAPVQRLNRGDQSGRIIGIIPGVISLAGLPIWFGAPNLPERATPGSVDAERAQATQSGVRPLAADKLRAVTLPSVTAPDLAALLRDRVASLVLEHSPQDKELANAWRADTATASPNPKR